MTASEPDAKHAAAVTISMCTARFSWLPHSGISSSDMIDSLTVQVSKETGVTTGIWSIVSFCSSAADLTRSIVEETYSKP